MSSNQENHQQVFASSNQKSLGRCLDRNGRPIGNLHLNSCLYNVEFKDGTTDIIFTNTIANKIWDKVGESGSFHSLLHSIFDCMFQSKAVNGDGYVVNCDGKRCIRKTTAGDKL